MWEKIYVCCCSCNCFQDRNTVKNEGQGEADLDMTGSRGTRTTYSNRGFRLSYDYDSNQMKQDLSQTEDPSNIIKEKHPLTNSLILAKIFVHVSLHDLYTCRLVNRQWNTESSKHIRKNGEPIWLQTVEIPDFLKLMKKTQDNPFTRYALNLTSDSSPSLIYFPPTNSKTKQNHIQKHSIYLQNESQQERVTNTREFLRCLSSNILMLIIQCYDLDLPHILEYLDYAKNLQSLLLMVFSETTEIEEDIVDIRIGHGIRTPAPISPLRSHTAQKQIVRAQVKMGKFRGLLKLGKLAEVRVIKVRTRVAATTPTATTNAWVRGHGHGQNQNHNLINQDVYIDISKCVIEILNSSSKIEIIDLRNIQFCSSVGDSLKNIFVLGSQAFTKVNYLSLNAVNEPQLRALSRVASNLKSLELNLKGGVEDVTFFEILNRNAASLESLQVSNDELNGVFYFPIKMSQIKTIVLKQWKGPVLVDSIVLNCPTLEKLDFENYNPDNIVMHSKQFKHENLERLGLLLNDRELVMFPLRKIKGLYKRLLPQFPNVKDFYSAAETDDILQLIFSSINHYLDSLYLDCSMQISDASLTGIPFEVLEAIQVDQIERLRCGCWVFKEAKNFRKFPYAGSLPHLTQFHVSIEPGAQITNLSLHHGVADLKSLQVLRLHSKDFRWCLQCIADNLPNLEKLYLKSKQLYHVDDLSYLHQRLPFLEIEFISDPNESMHFLQ